MKRGFAVLLCVVIPFVMFAADTQNGYNVAYDGGSLSLKAGVGVKLYVDNKNVRLVKDKTEIATIPVSAITEITYGQDVHRRVGAAIGLAFVEKTLCRIDLG